MTGVPPVAHRAIGLGFLVSSLLLIGPAGSSAEGKPHRPAQKRVAASKPSTGVAGADRPEQGDRCVHVVRRDDALARVAAHYRVTRRSIIAANRLTAPDRLRVGQRLQISGCRAVVPRRPDEPETISASGDGTELLARVGPRRVPTRLFLAVPDFRQEATVFQWPIEGPIASGFGRRHRGWHAGIDIKADMGTPIRAAAGGTVIVSGWERYYGRMVKIQHAGGFTSLYAHNLENLVEVGDEVEAETVIATVGRSGLASATHLHFEIRHEGMAYNPLHLLEARDAPVVASAPTAALSDEEDRE